MAINSISKTATAAARAKFIEAKELEAWIAVHYNGWQPEELPTEKWSNQWARTGIFSDNDINVKLNLPRWNEIPNLTPCPPVDLNCPNVQSRLQDRAARPWTDDEWWDRQAELALADSQVQPPLHHPQPPVNNVQAPNINVYTITMKGNASRLHQILQCPQLSDHWRRQLQNLGHAMDANGVSWFQPLYPSSVGSVKGGRATFRDTRGKGNTVLTCNEEARAYIYGEFYDEIDISRSHITAVIGCFSLTRAPPPVTMLRYINEQQLLENDIEQELAAARPELETKLNKLRATAAGVANKEQQKLITFAQGWVQKTYQQAKHIFSAAINLSREQRLGWQDKFRDDNCPTIRQLIFDIPTLCSAIPKHPLCVEFARALTEANTTTVRLHSLCLAHLDEHTLGAAAYALTAIGLNTGITINDSLCILRPQVPLFTKEEICSIASQAATLRLGYSPSFKYNPHMQKPEQPLPTLLSVLTALGAAPPPSSTPPGQQAPNAPPNNPPGNTPLTATQLQSQPPQHPQPQQPEDPWRDLAGDATTVATQTANQPPQCALASARNLTRRALLTEQEVTQRFCPSGHISSIDYTGILDELVCNEGEVAAQVFLRGPRAIVLTNDLTHHINCAFCVTQGANGWCTHVVALIKINGSHPTRFRLYDNDSSARLNGTFSSVPPTYFAHHAQRLYITTDQDSPLERRLRSSPTVVGGAGSSSSSPRRDSNLESQVSC